MDATNKEIRCLMQRLLELTDRNAARYDRMIELLDSCRATGGTPSSPSTSTGSDVCDGAEVPAPASHNPVAEVRAPASSDSDVTLDADGPAAPTRTTHSTGDPSHDTTESRSATGTTMEPTVHTATVEIVSVLAAPAATDGTPDGQGISGVTLTPATCSTACLSRHPVVAPVLVASLLPVLTESVSQGFSSSVSLVKEALRVYPSASTDFITTAPATCSTYCSAQQPVAALLLVASSTAIRPEYGLDTNNIPMLPLYNGSKFFMLTSGQRIKSKVPRPMPWPSFMGVHIEARPLPWPSFGRVNGYEFLSYAIQKASQWCSSDNSHTESCTVIGFQISDFCAHTNHTPIVWLPCTISGFHLLVMFRSLELKLLSIGPTPEAFVNYAIPDASFWPGYFVTGSQMNLVFTAANRCSHWIVSGVCDGPTVSSLFTFRWYKWVLHPCNSGQHAPSRDSGQQLSGAFQNAAYWPANFVTSGQMQVTKDFTQRKSSGLDTMDRHILELLSSALATICWAYFQLLVHYLNNYQLTILVTAAGHRMLLARYQNGEKNSHMLLLPWVLEQKEPSITFQFQESSSRSDWCRGNQSNSSLSIEKTGLYTAGSIPSLDKLQEPMKLMAMPVSWQYFSHMELRESGNSISICLRLGSELERISVVPFLSTSCYTTIYNLLSKWYVGWEYMNSDVNTCSSCLNDGVIYTPCLCISGQILITLHKPQPPVQSISKELLIREPYGRNCCVAILSLVLHSILSWNGSSISSHVFPLSLCEKPHGTGYLWQGSIHAEVTFWLDYSFARIDKRPQARQSPHAHCSTGLQIINSVMRYLLCQLFLVRVMSWLEKLLLPTSPRPNAYCLITHTMFWDAYLSCLIICKVWRHNHQNTVQMEIGWPPRAQVGFITSKSGMPWLLVLMRIQGRKNIGVYHIYHQDQVCTDHDYQLGFSRDIGGTKKRTLSWDPGGRHMTSLDRHTVLQFPWDPGVAAAAWGQAAFQGGRDVRDPSYTAPWAGTWAIIMGWTYYRDQQLSYKYRRSINGEGEAERIKKCRGRVFALQDEPEVPRVWLPFDDAPGLAMARAFGDFCLKDYGVISVPDFFHWSLTDKDQFVILASDGVWDVLSNQEAVDIVSSSPSRSKAARTLVEAANREWKTKYPTSRTDDCAVVCLYLDGKMDHERDSTASMDNISIEDGSVADPNEAQEQQEPTLTRNFTVRTVPGSAQEKALAGIDAKMSGAADDHNWSGLDGVTRVNSLVQLPRFSEEKAMG